MRQSLDFHEMEFRTKVRAKYLRALEEERFDQLPAHTYIKGFLRTYADALGMDGQLYVDEYNSRYVAGEDEHPLRTRRCRKRRRRARAPRVAARRRRGDGDHHRDGARDRRVEVRRSRTSRRCRASTRSRSRSSRPRLDDSGAPRGASFMEVRIGSRAGQAAVPAERWSAGRCNASARAALALARSPGNVVVTVDGKRVKMPKSGELIVPARS